MQQHDRPTRVSKRSSNNLRWYPTGLDLYSCSCYLLSQLQQQVSIFGCGCTEFRPLITSKEIIHTEVLDTHNYAPDLVQDNVDISSCKTAQGNRLHEVSGIVTILDLAITTILRTSIGLLHFWYELHVHNLVVI